MCCWRYGSMRRSEGNVAESGIGIRLPQPHVICAHVVMWSAGKPLTRAFTGSDHRPQLSAELQCCRNRGRSFVPSIHTRTS